MDRLSTKLTMLTRERIVVEDYKVSGDRYLAFATNGRAYFINREGKTWSTNDDRVKTIRDCKTYAKEKIWDSHGDINQLKQSLKHRL